MAIELKITVNHATDLAAEVQQLAQIIGGGAVPVAAAPVQTPVGKVTHNDAPAAGTVSLADKLDKAEKAVAGAAKTLNRKEQDEAVAEMVKNAAKDDRFDLLTKGRQNEVTAALEKPAATTATKDADLDDMFSDDAKPAAATVTREQVSELMGKIGKDKDGNPIQERLLKIRAILVDNIPEGQEVKVRSIPEDKLAAVYAAIEKVT